MKYGLIIDTKSVYTDLRSFYNNKTIAYRLLSEWLESQLNINFTTKIAFGYHSPDRHQEINRLIQFFHNNFFETNITPYSYDTELGIRSTQLLMQDHDLVLVTAKNDHANVARFARKIGKTCYLVNCRPSPLFRSLAACMVIPEEVLLDKDTPNTDESVSVSADVPSDADGDSDSKLNGDDNT